MVVLLEICNEWEMLQKIEYGLDMVSYSVTAVK